MLKILEARKCFFLKYVKDFSLILKQIASKIFRIDLRYQYDKRQTS